MERVQLAESEALTDEMSFISIFIQAAFTQGFDAKWVEAIIDAAVANGCANFWPVMLGHIEIVSPQHVSQQPLEGER